jgi:hypothetical protein
MSIGHVGTKLASLAHRGEARRHAVGERLELKVLQRLDEHRYRVSFQEANHVVQSTVPLTVGSTVRATVTAVGEKLELRYVGADEVAVTMQDHAALGEDSLAQLARRYSVALQAGQRAVIEQEMTQAQEPETMAACGMFLSKLALPLESRTLRAVYDVQNWETNAAPAPRAAANPTAVISPVLVGIAEQLLASLQGNGADTQGDGDTQRQLAQRLLNEQDEGSVAYRYGILPILIDDQLLELDLVHFRERRKGEESPGVRRLVMTFSTGSLGRVEVLAQALGERLTIGIRTDSPAGREALAAQTTQLRELIGQLGWNVEAVSYQFDTQVGRAARHVIDHVLNADTLSRLV